MLLDINPPGSPCREVFEIYTPKTGLLFSLATGTARNKVRNLLSHGPE
jgi:hypothetical protein